MGDWKSEKIAFIHRIYPSYSSYIAILLLRDAVNPKISNTSEIATIDQRKPSPEEYPVHQD